MLARVGIKAFVPVVMIVMMMVVVVVVVIVVMVVPVAVVRMGVAPGARPGTASCRPVREVFGA